VKVAVRESDIFFRWGGEEFLVLLKGCHLERALQVAEKIRLAIAELPLTYDATEITLTASFGVAEHRPGESLDSLMKRVDQALYLAKAGGRNRSEIAPLLQP